ncbi:hypothetical protein BKA58DRAFT_378186 [Alternaria rosae]|uniref:uncharacterized protein n=1 Tax=Alternaria rosae TaxID=1187941 RepID=UPI001E8E635E|nr:uncharacterized protein BKA58DRAFT_378186 [Alternaria rosae]KAH6878902.1 hypothetical protein BKA58DRAFT_378186 [Alternaria rosae]
MAPLGPPPYTAEQLQAMTSQEERIRAQAELTSYITRAKREKQEREERERLQSNAYTGSGYRTTSGSFNHYAPPSIPSYAPVHNPVFNPVYTPVSNPSYNPPYSKYNQRGGYGKGRGRGAGGRGRGYTPYHPYTRSLNASMYTGFATDSNGTSIVTQPREANENKDLAHASADSTRSSSSDHQSTEPSRLCANFTHTGRCSIPGCPFRHDPDTQTVCKSFLFKGACPDSNCQLSHTASSHNTPTCQHFQAGRCTKEDCRFAHVRVNPSAPNCEAFGRLGYCEKGDTCAELHAFECPTFANTGECSYTGRFHYPHVRLASRMRKITRLSSPAQSPPNSPVRSPVRSPAHSPSSHTPATSDAPEDDMDTAEDAHEWMMPKTGTSPKPQQFTQQADFVAFENDDE